ncbi:MAG: hypothetical protein MJZ98_02720 [Paludibacteraceae bacterium]|nr:hypothetical protein [Paludibacteraceae bacterium]
MNTKLQELTDKIYSEGVEKGKTEAAELVAKAQKEAAEIVAKAKSEAENIMNAANRNAEELKKNTQSELKLFADQSVNALRTEVANLLCGKLATDSVKAATADKGFMQGLIADLCKQWVNDGEVKIDAKNAQELTDYFTANAKELLNKGVKINEVKGLKTDFSIAPAQGGYKISFGDAEFVEYFKEFLRPKLVEMLFGK